MSTPVYVGVELGGTKVVVAASTDGPGLIGRRTVPTRDPDSTFTGIRAAIEDVTAGEVVAGIGVASFGPIDLRPGSHRFGTLLQTPKEGWSDTDVLGGISNGRDVPVALDTDVNAALLGECTWGAGTAEHVAYLTVGTGIGGAIWSNGRVIRGLNHSEIGHLRVPRHPHDHRTSSCPFHDDCLEGMASGEAITRRWGTRAPDLGGRTSEAVKLEAWYLAHGIAGLCAVVPVAQVIVGGGVSKLEGLHDAVAGALADASALYPPVPFAEGGPQILAPGLGDDSGVVGAIELARPISAVSRG